MANDLVRNTDALDMSWLEKKVPRSGINRLVAECFFGIRSERLMSRSLPAPAITIITLKYSVSVVVDVGGVRHVRAHLTHTRSNELLARDF